MTATAALLVLGSCAAVSVLPLSGVVAVLLFGSLLGAFALLVQHDDARSTGSGWRLVAGAVLIGVAVLAATGLLAVLGGAAWLLILLVLASSPWAVRRARVVRSRWSATGAARSSGPAAYGGWAVTDISPTVVPLGDPAVMDIEELCWAWRRSYVRLQRCRTVAERTQVVAERQQCLDELERRDPCGLTAWLESGARAAGDPRPYVDPAGPSDCHDAA